MYGYSGNHERDWPGTGSFYVTTDSGGECGVVYSTTHAMPTTKDKEWYELLSFIWLRSISVAL
jgi:hypothetical protein